MSKNIDLKKLEELSCLRLPKDKEEDMSKSIQGVFEMLHEIDKVEVNHINSNSNSPSILADDVVNNEYLFDKNVENDSLNIEDGFFLAPKVISKE